MIILKILVTGAGGLLGSALIGKLNERGYETLSLYNTHKPKFGTPVKLDLSTNMQKIFNAVYKMKPQIIVHIAALTNVDECERNPDIAWRVNAQSTLVLAKVSRKINARLIYISTDYVFDGKKGSYEENDLTNPINIYGATKLIGEYFVKTYSDNWVIFRTSTIFGWGYGTKRNFGMWVIENLLNNSKIRALNDIYSSPTLNTNLADVIIEAIELDDVTGLYHVSGISRVSRYDWALEIAKNLGKEYLVEAIDSSQIVWLAKRPKDSSLNVEKASKYFKTKLLSISESVIEFIKYGKKIGFIPK